MTRRALTTLLALSAALTGAIACGSSEDEEPVDETPIVGLYELPISRNNQGTAPTEAALIEISPTELRVDHVKVLDLTRGRPADQEVADHELTALAVRLRTGAQRRRVALKAHATVPYLTLVEVLKTVHTAGLREVHVAVRTLGNSPTEGWMPIRNFQVVPQEGEIEWASRTLPWSAFTERWRDVYEACRAPGPGHYIDCDAPYTNVAEGGELEMELWTRAMGMKVTFSQVNPPEPEAGGGGGGGGAQLIEGIAPVAPPPSGDDEEASPPATAGAFTLRHQESTQEESGISNAVAPVCANQACQAVVVADATGQTMRVISLLGAVFANGHSEGEIAFRIPR